MSHDPVATLCAAIDRELFGARPVAELLEFAARETAREFDVPLIRLVLPGEEKDVEYESVAGPADGSPREVDERWHRRAFPLRIEGGDPGTMEVWAEDASFFARNRTERFGQLADHLSLVLDHRQEIRSLETTRRRFRQMAENIEEAFYLRDPHLEILYLSPAFEEVWGRPVEELYEDPGIWPEMIHPEDRERVLRTAFENQARGFSAEYRVVLPDGEIRWVHEQSYPVTDDSGELEAVAGVGSDVTERRARQEELRRQREWYRSLFEDSRDAILIMDVEGRFLEVNDAFVELSGYRRGELEEVRAADFYVERDEHDELMRKLEEQGRVDSMEVRLRREDGEIRHCIVTASRLEAVDGFRVQATIRDITERVLREVQIEHEAMHDWLTDLPNRVLFEDRLEQAIARVQRTGTTLALLYVDLNDFKAVNDRHGHDAGDTVLVETARRLSRAVRDPDTVARIGGDEFCVILPDVSGGEGVEAVARRVAGSFREPVSTEDADLSLTVAVGAALVSESGDGGVLSPAEARRSPDELVRRADRAMYAAKQQTGSALRMYRAHSERRQSRDQSER